MKKEPMIEIPAKFWGEISQAEWLEVCTTSMLNAEMCRRLWRMTDRQGEPPEKVQVLINREQLMKAFPRIKK
jgi:hypothetical protein